MTKKRELLPDKNEPLDINNLDSNFLIYNGMKQYEELLNYFKMKSKEINKNKKEKNNFRSKLNSKDNKAKYNYKTLKKI